MRKAIVGTVAAGLLAAIAVVALPGCRLGGGTGKADTAVAELEAKSGSTLKGRAVFKRIAGDWLELRIEIRDVPPGLHAVHIHEFGDCSAPDAASAGGHWNPTGKKHGQWGQPDGEFHLGDIGNIEVGANGTGSLVLTTDLWSIGGAGNDILGKSIIVHEKGDDFTTQPTGDAGGRIGCGVIGPGR